MNGCMGGTRKRVKSEGTAPENVRGRVMAHFRSISLIVILHVTANVHIAEAVDLEEALPPGAVARIGTTRFWHGWTDNPLTFTPSGKEIVACGTDGVIRVWDVITASE